MSTALRTVELSVRFGGVRALQAVSIDVPAEGLTGLIGPNGAGKSTFVDAVTGFLRDRVEGAVLLGGDDITSASPNRRAHLGLGRTWQTQELFEDVSVAENLAIAASRLTVWGAVRDMLRRPANDVRVAQTLEELGLTRVAHREPRELTQRERKLVGVARAIVGRPRLALLDEPAAGLDRSETAWLGDRLRAIADAGTPILLIDHDMSLILKHSDLVHVLDNGKLLASGTPAQVRADENVIRAYLGSTAGDAS